VICPFTIVGTSRASLSTVAIDQDLLVFVIGCPLSTTI
jgi:hypothetical protein